MKTKARIVSIDKDLKAISRASKFIKTLDLQNVIKLEHADALYFPVENFDVIFVLYGVRQQKEILNYLSNNMNDRARIVFRTTTDSRGRIQGGRIDLSNLFEIKNHIKSETLGQTDSFLLYKKISN